MSEPTVSIVTQAVESRRKTSRPRRRGRAFTAFRVAIQLLILAAIIAVTYLHYVGFPQFVQRWVIRELAKKDIDAHWSVLRFDLLEGLVAKDAVFYELRAPHRQIAKAQEVVVHVRPLRFARWAEAVTAISVSNADLEMPALEGFFAKDASAVIDLSEPGVIEVKELRGIYGGVRLNLSGRVRLPTKVNGAPAIGPRTADDKNATLARRIADEFQAFKFDPAHPPEVSVRFDSDMNNLRELLLEVQVRAQDIGYSGRDGRSLKIDGLEAQFSVSGQALLVKEFRCKLYEGEVATIGPATCDLAEGRILASLRSTTDLQKLAPFLPPSARRGLAELEFTSNPRLSCEIEFSENTGTHPAVRHGRVDVVNFKYRTIPVRSFRGEWEFIDSNFALKNAEVIKSEGTMRVNYRGDVETTEFEAQFDGVINPSTLFPIMTPAQVKFLSQFEFGDAARCSDMRVRGNWHFPKENEVGGHLTLGRWRWRGVDFGNLSADVEWKQEVVRFTKAVVQRGDETVSGGFAFDGKNGAFECDASGTMFPTEIIVAAWPKTRAQLEPYKVETPPQFDLRGWGNALKPESIELAGRAKFGRGTARGVPFKSGEVEFRYKDGITQVDDFEAQREEGEATGALTWDARRNEVTGEIISTVNLSEVTPIFGPQAVKSMMPYQFAKPPLMWASGTVAFGEPSRTDFQARIEGNDFVLVAPRRQPSAAALKTTPDIKPGDAPAPPNAPVPPIRLVAETIAGDLEYKNNQLRLQNLEATFYGGSLKGWGEFQFGKEAVTYRSEFAVDKSSLADIIRAFSTKEGKVASGLLTGSVTLTEGNFDDLKTMKGTAQAQITDGHVLDVPIFGLASVVLNMLPGKLGNAKAKNAAASFVLADGQINTTDMVVETSGTKTTLKGWVDWDGAVDFEVKTRGSGIADILINPLRWLTDVRVTGTMDKPDIKAIRLP